MKKILLFIYLLIFSLLPLTSCSDEKIIPLNIDALVDNNNSILSKTYIAGSHSSVIRLYVGENYVILENASLNGDSRTITYTEYFTFENKKIYHNYDLRSRNENNNGRIKRLIGYDDNFYNFKRFIQLAFIYLDIKNEVLYLNDLIDKLINDLNVDLKDNDLGLYYNLLNYYDTDRFIGFNKNDETYVIDDFKMELFNEKLKKISYNDSNINVYITMDDIGNFLPPDFKEYKTHDLDKIIDKLEGNIDKLYIGYVEETDLKLINSSLTIKGKVRRLFASDEEYGKLRIKEYTSKKECLKVYNEFMNNYLHDSLYFAIDDKFFYMSTLPNEQTIYDELLDVEFKSSKKYEGCRNVLEDNIYTLSFEADILDIPDSVCIIKNYNEYASVVNKMKEVVYENTSEDIKEAYFNQQYLSYLSLISENDFITNDYLLIQYNDMYDDYDNPYPYIYSIDSAYLIDGNMDIVIINSGRESADMVYTKFTNVAVYKVPKNLNFEHSSFVYFVDSKYFYGPQNIGA